MLGGWEKKKPSSPGEPDSWCPRAGSQIRHRTPDPVKHRRLLDSGKGHVCTLGAMSCRPAEAGVTL